MSEEPRYHIIQPLRDPESNWAVDLAKDLEEYLVKICSGDVTGDDEGHLSINFAEAALILQGSVQVYSRKVEYLYKLVLQALEVLSQKRQQDQTEESSAVPEGHDSNAVLADENEPFLGLDDVPVEAKNCLDDGRSKGHTSNQFVKPPANLVVLEGDCFDSIGDVGELESYLLATHDLYRDFILLDPYDAGSVDKYLEDDEEFGRNSIPQRGSQVKPKTPRSAFLSPSRQFGATAHKSPLAKSVGKNINKTPEINQNVGINDNIWPDLSAGFGFPENDYHGGDGNNGYPESMDEPDESDDDDDPWRPLNPHEIGTLKVKPFKKGKTRRNLKVTTNNLMSLASQFPVARLHGVINPEYKNIWETTLREKKSVQKPESLPLYERLRQSLGGNDNLNAFTNHEEDNEDNDAPDFGHADFTMADGSYMEAEGPLDHVMNDGAADFASNDFGTEDPESQASLEDLCRSHLDALLASIAETEKQTELAARVSTWKQRIEGTLEEQDSHPPFDIHEYGERVLNKLSMEGESGSGMSFADVVRGQEKHEVARTFSALLQLVNNRSVDLDKGECSSQSVCYTAVNPFYVRPLININRTENVNFRSKKRGKSPMLNSVSKTARKKSFL